MPGFLGSEPAKVRAERNQLWQEFIRVVERVQPKVFVIENVDRFVRSPEFNDLQSRMQSGDLENYILVDPPGVDADDPAHVRARGYLLNSADYGSPQARRRAIVIGVRTNTGLDAERFRYPRPTNGRAVVAADSRAEWDLAGMPGLEPWVAASTVFEDSAERALTGVDLPRRERMIDEVAGPYLTTDLHITRNPEPLSLARYRAISPAGNRKDLRGTYLCTSDDGPTDHLIRKVGTFREGDGELAVEGDYLVLDGEHRGLSVSVTLADGGPRRRVATPGRRRSESYSVQVKRGAMAFNARLDYLSTASWDAHDAGSGDVMGRVRAGVPSVTIRTEFFKPEKGRYLHPTECRPITHYEAAKLQGFPDEFLWCGSKTEIARQIGNAVPIPLGRGIAQSIYEYLRSTVSATD
ncbi:DNA cytosine methyltransferase [Oerskovia sp. M15]